MSSNLPDFKRWEVVVKNPFWYLQLVPEFQELLELRHTDIDEYERCKEGVYSFFEKQLLAGNIPLDESRETGKDWDHERKPIDTIVIHHTSNPPGMSLPRLSAIELIRLYAPQYAKKEIPRKIYSGHFRDGMQVFYPYHWFIRQGGSTERLLYDREIGWQAGNWDINCRSIAICFDNDLEETRPSERELVAAAELIRERYPNVRKERILGHCEVKPETTCPSNLFLSTDNQKGWKEDLLGLI